MADIKVSTQEIRGAAEYIRTSNANLKELLEDVYTTAKNLCGNSWTSDAATEFCKKLDSFKSRTFDNYFNETDAYQKFLDRTAEKYESTETTNEGNVATDIIDTKAGLFE